MADPLKSRLPKLALGGALTAGALALYSHWAGRRAEKQAPADGAFLDVDGARLHYLDRGDGPAIVMVPHRVILVDRPRSGYSTAAPGTEPGIADQAALIARFIERLGLEKPLLVGHSLGGAVALALALDHPETVRGLALIAPLTQARTEVPPMFRGLQARAKASRAIIANIVGVPLGQLTSPLVMKQVFAPEPVPADFGVRGGGVLALRPGNLNAASFEMSAAMKEIPALVARYGEIRMPVAILYGREDHVLDHHLNGVVTSGEITGATLDLIKGGHMLPVTQPERVAAFVRAAA